MNKDAALARLAALESETKALRTIIEQPEPETSVLSSTVPTLPWCLDGSYGTFTPDRFYGETAPEAHNWFADKQQAAAWAEAFNTMLEARRLPGSNVRPGKQGFFFRVRDDRVVIMSHDKVALNAVGLPRFTSYARAEAAVKVLGEERLIRVIKLLCNA